MRFKQIFVVMALAALALVGCRQQAPADTASLKIVLDTSAASLAVGETTLIITIHNADNAPVSDAKVAVRGDMNHAGMVPVLRDVEGGQEGRYEVPFEWTMGGDWIVDITATLPNGNATTTTFNLSVTSDGTDTDHDSHNAESHEEEAHDETSEHAEDEG